MKTRLILLFFSIVISGYCFGQKVLTVDFDSIKIKISDPKSACYYPKLMERFGKADTTLTDDELDCIYYGNIFSEKYTPYGGLSKDDDKFYKFYNKGKYKKAIPYGKKGLKENPVDLKMLFKMTVCYDQLGDKKTAQEYADRYFPLLHVITRSGDGKTIETAYVVTCVADEYEILADMDLGSTQQALYGDTDKLSISPENQKNDPKITALYFNVQVSMNYLEKEFEKEVK